MQGQQRPEVIQVLSRNIVIKCSYVNCPNNDNSRSHLHVCVSERTRHERILQEAALHFKSCHYCYTFYCSRECRERDWPEHKLRVCYYGRLATCCKRVLAKCGRTRELRREISHIARTAFLSTCDRGFVWLDFASCSDAEHFLCDNNSIATASSSSCCPGSSSASSSCSGGSSSPFYFEHKREQHQQQSQPPASSSNFLVYFGDSLLPKYVSVKQEPQKPPKKRHHQQQQPSERFVVLSELFAPYYQQQQSQETTSSALPQTDYDTFHELCSSYDPFSEFLLLVSVRIDSNSPSSSSDMQLLPRKLEHQHREVKYVLKYMKLKLVDGGGNEATATTTAAMGVSPKSIDSGISHETTSSSTSSTTQPSTLILTSLQENGKKSPQLVTDDISTASSASSTGSGSASSSKQTVSSAESRQLFLANVINEFEIRGINLRQYYPKIYRDLCVYVEQNRPFTPLCLFPRDMKTKDLFMCIIVPNSEPSFYSWLYEDNNLPLQQQKSSNHEEVDKNNNREPLPFNLSQFLYII